MNSQQEERASQDIASDVSSISTPNSSKPSDTGLARNTRSKEIEGSSRSSLGRCLTEDEIVRVLSRRRTSGSGEASEGTEDMAQIVKLVSRMFGRERKVNSDEKKKRGMPESYGII